MDYPSEKAPPIPRDFIWRRLQSLMGLWLVLFLTEHLLINSQAALFIGDDGSGFVTAVNSIKELPYLPFIELFLIGVPFIIHGYWGIHYLLTSEVNSFVTDGTKVALPQYTRNQAFTWQRVTSWILLLGVIAHVIHMRVIEYPVAAQRGTEHFYMVRLNMDNGLYTLSRRLGFELVTPEQVKELSHQLATSINPLSAAEETPDALIRAQAARENEAWVKALEWRPLAANQQLAISKTFGIAELLMVRDSFKNPLHIFLYTIFVLAAGFHAFNGLWTSFITWGITLTATAQWIMRRVAITLMCLVTFLGLAAIWGTYWLNLTS